MDPWLLNELRFDDGKKGLIIQINDKIPFFVLRMCDILV